MGSMDQGQVEIVAYQGSSRANYPQAVPPAGHSKINITLDNLSAPEAKLKNSNGLTKRDLCAIYQRR